MSDEEKSYTVEVFKVRALDTPIMRIERVVTDSTVGASRVFRSIDGSVVELPAKDFAFKYRRPPNIYLAPIPPPGLFEQAAMRRVQAERERRAKGNWFQRFFA